MSKWNKKQPQISQQFLQNQQRRKQMILQAAKRRRQKQKRQQQQKQQARKLAQQAIVNHKKSKQQAYVKYLRNNMHDKYQLKKRQELDKKPQIASVSKWKKNSKQNNDLSALNLDIDPRQKAPSPIKKYQNKNNYQQSTKIVKKSQISQKKKHLIQQFQKQWNNQQQQSIQSMIDSQLLDSLDLDFDTLSRGQQINKNMKKIKRQQQLKIKNQRQQQKLKIDKAQEQIKQLIGYQSILFSIDERKNNFKRDIQKNNIEYQNNNNTKNKNNQLKKVQEQKPINQGQAFNQLKNKKQGKILNWAKQDIEEADQLFSNCSSKRGQKTLSQLNQQIRKERIMKKTNNNKVQNLQTIPQSNKSKKSIENNANTNNSKNKLPLVEQKNNNDIRKTSIDKKQANSTNNLKSGQIQKQTSKQKKNISFQQQRKKVINAYTFINKDNNNRNTSQQKIKINQQLNKKNGVPINNNIRQRSRQNINKIPNHQNNFNNNKSNQIKKNRNDYQEDNNTQRSKNNNNGISKNLNNLKQRSKQRLKQKSKQRSNSYQKKQSQSQTQYNNNQNNKVSQNTYYVPVTRPQYSVTTHNQHFQIDSFIRNDLISLNQQQRQLQQQLRQIHVNNKNLIKQVQQKYQIKKHYKHSNQIIYGQQPQQGYGKPVQNQDQLQESIQRLDNHLIRKDLKTRQRQQRQRITQARQESQCSINSFINPLSNPIELHKQILQLAQNISKFDNIDPNKVPQTGGYASKNMKKWKKPNNNNQGGNYNSYDPKKNNQIDKYSSIGTQDVLSQSKNVSNCTQQNIHTQYSSLSKPPQFQYSRKKSRQQLKKQAEQQQQQNVKIQVNQKLRNLLLDDD